MPFDAPTDQLYKVQEENKIGERMNKYHWPLKTHLSTVSVVKLLADVELSAEDTPVKCVCCKAVS